MSCSSTKRLEAPICRGYVTPNCLTLIPEESALTFIDSLCVAVPDRIEALESGSSILNSMTSI
jgi:hypothetical protein